MNNISFRVGPDNSVAVSLGENTLEAARQAGIAGIHADAAGAYAGFAEEFSGIAYDTRGAGESATSTGQFFRVWNGDAPRTYIRYQRTAGGSSIAAPLATTAALATSAGAAMVGFKPIGTDAATIDVQRMISAMPVNVMHYMTEAQVADVRAGTALVNVSDAIIKAHTVSKNVYYPDGRYLVSWPEGTSFFSYASQTGIRIFGAGATIVDKRVYASTATLSVFFNLTSCSDVKIDLNYEGVPLTDKTNATTGIGYRGATLVNLSTACKNVTVNGELKYLRYGVRGGGYTLFATGYNDDITTNLTTFECGYPVALYLSTGVDVDIYAVGSHRAGYFAGCRSVKGTIRFKDQYIAPVQVLLTDATTNGENYPTGQSRACSDIDIECIDMGSTISPGVASWCCGISLSRVDPMAYQNIRLRYYVKSSDTVASNLGGFVVVSAATSYEPSYPQGWSSDVHLRNLDIGGVIDRSAQTTSEHSTGEIYIGTATTNNTHFATVDGFKLSHIYIPGSGAKPRGHWFIMPGLVGQATLENCDFGSDTPFIWNSNANSNTTFNTCRLRGSYNGTSDPLTSAIHFVSCTGLKMAYQPLTNKVFTNTKLEGAGGTGTYRYKMTELTLTGESVTWVNCLPSDSIIHFVVGCLTQGITGSTGYQVGDGTTVGRFGNFNALNAGHTFTMSHGSDTTPFIQKGTGSITVTRKTSDFTAGKIRLLVGYDLVTAPTA